VSVTVKRGQVTDHPKMDPNLMLRRAYTGQVIQSMKMEGLPALVTVTTGTSAFALIASAAGISNFSTRFASLFEEYRIVRIQFRVKFFNSTASGIVITWFDEKSLIAPTLSEARTKSSPQRAVNLSRVNRDMVLTWTPHDTVDLQYLDTAASPIGYGAFKLYTDTANFGCLAGAGAICQVYPTYTVQFRGLR